MIQLRPVLYPMVNFRQKKGNKKVNSVGLTGPKILCYISFYKIQNVCHNW